MILILAKLLLFHKEETAEYYQPIIALIVAGTVFWALVENQND
ncbi:hypothetical protein [Companilactobacillus zhachilii]|nr:hypothetical protein [Companilactobacillus zhachilii]